MTTNFESKTIKPNRSVPLRFIGAMIAETQWDTRNGDWMAFIIYETRGGAYIAVTEGNVPGNPDRVERTATVVIPIVGEAGERDENAMRIAVLAHFEFHDRAKAMLKRELGWSPFIEVQ